MPAMIFATLIANLIARYAGERRASPEDETPPRDESRPSLVADRGPR
jgi:hypothetical protein